MVDKCFLWFGDNTLFESQSGAYVIFVRFVFVCAVWHLLCNILLVALVLASFVFNMHQRWKKLLAYIPHPPTKPTKLLFSHSRKVRQMGEMLRVHLFSNWIFCCIKNVSVICICIIHKEPSICIILINCVIVSVSSVPIGAHPWLQDHLYSLG